MAINIKDPKDLNSGIWRLLVVLGLEFLLSVGELGQWLLGKSNVGLGLLVGELVEHLHIVLLVLLVQRSLILPLRVHSLT